MGDRKTIVNIRRVAIEYTIAQSGLSYATASINIIAAEAIDVNDVLFGDIFYLCYLDNSLTGHGEVQTRNVTYNYHYFGHTLSGSKADTLVPRNR